MSPQLDFILVGQGLSGSVLAFLLARRGYKICVIDADSNNSASMASAGIINPVSGQRLVLRDDFQKLASCTRDCYGRMQDQFGTRFYRPVDQLRVFNSANQAGQWQSRLELAEYAALLKTGGPFDARINGLSSHHGSCVLGDTGYLDTPSLLMAVRTWLTEKGWLLKDHFHHDELVPANGELVYRGLHARKIIFCEGVGARDNPWFPDLPFQPSCGEILTVRLSLDSDMLINWGHWLLPVSQGTYRLGATNDWDIDRHKPSTTARQQLLDSLHSILPLADEVEVIEHVRGLRPATRDRIPLIGRHDTHPELVLFTGFGGKGALTIPSAATLLIDHLQDGIPLPTEYAIYR